MAAIVLPITILIIFTVLHTMFHSFKSAMFVHFICEGVNDGVQVYLVAVTRELYAVRKTAFNIQSSPLPTDQSGGYTPLRCIIGGVFLVFGVGIAFSK